MFSRIYVSILLKGVYISGLKISRFDIEQGKMYFCYKTWIESSNVDFVMLFDSIFELYLDIDIFDNLFISNVLVLYLVYERSGVCNIWPFTILTLNLLTPW